MIDDLNKTELTHDITRAAITWMAGKGFKPLQTEVRISNGWVADIAGVIKPTQTELIELKIIRRAPKWSVETADAVAAWVSKVKALGSQPLIGLIEVKASRADFLSDEKWSLPQPANFVWVAVPKGLIAESELPPSWGILEFSDGDIRALRQARLVDVSPGLQRDVIFEIGIRLHNTTDAETIQRREDMRTRADRMKAQRLSDTIAGVCSIVESKRSDFNLALAFSKLPTQNLSEAEVVRLQALFGLGRHLDSRVHQQFCDELQEATR